MCHAGIVRWSALLLLLSVAGRANAQSGGSAMPRGDVSVGGFWSANVATAKYTPAPFAVDSRQWSGAGATIVMPLSKVWSLDGRVMWNRRGATSVLASGGASRDLHADYLSTPVLLKAAVGHDVRAYAVAGPEASFRIRSSVGTKRFDWLADIGGGIERDLGRGVVFVEALYAHGFTNVLTPHVAGESARTRTVTLLSGVRF